MQCWAAAAAAALVVSAAPLLFLGWFTNQQYYVGYSMQVLWMLTRCSTVPGLTVCSMQPTTQAAQGFVFGISRPRGACQIVATLAGKANVLNIARMHFLRPHVKVIMSHNMNSLQQNITQYHYDAPDGRNVCE
jgi:hypothetical protein